MKKQIAVIELASNELRLKIGEKSDMKVKTVDSLSYPVTLGRESFHNGKISFFLPLSSAKSYFRLWVPLLSTGWSKFRFFSLIFTPSY